jgi:hypothetical protein
LRSFGRPDRLKLLDHLLTMQIGPYLEVIEKQGATD